MKVLVACEYSGVVRDAFRALGHDAISCDLLPTERPGPHIQGDVREVLQRPWDLVIAHPPCTWLTSARGALTDVGKMIEAACFFNDCYCANAPLVAVENPQCYKLARKIIGEPDCKVEPFQFGDLTLKRTWWWLRGLPPLMPTHYSGEDGTLPVLVGGGRHNIEKRGKRVNRSPKERAEFHSGMAAAMAKQWGNCQ